MLNNKFAFTPQDVSDHILDRLAAEINPDEPPILDASTPRHIINRASRMLKGIISGLAKSGWPIFPPLEPIFEPFGLKLSEGLVTFNDLMLVINAHAVDFDTVKASLLARADALQRMPATAA